ncbi:MAG TPA: ADP-ribosylglycohydrolase family protein, partial [Armatimonadaceae bacterium]|nr:ADP-ribosylglycohydrolase family protein [Armatimonadaceae bacterium]
MSDRVSGCLFGLALGDALAATVEFVRDVRAIEARLGPRGSRAEPLGDPARVTDDTQMALALGDALVECSGPPWTAERVEPPLRRAFVDWMDSPENTRAPGNTCMSACRRLKQGLPWVEATVLTSKGCGANMRVAPVGLLGGENSATRAGLAQFQA